MKCGIQRKTKKIVRNRIALICDKNLKTIYIVAGLLSNKITTKVMINEREKSGKRRRRIEKELVLRTSFTAINKEKRKKNYDGIFISTWLQFTKQVSN